MRTLSTYKAIEPFYFGTLTKPLFGCHHKPQGNITRDCGVVLCYPMGSEYDKAHRSYTQLALRLSKNGFHVLRFDFYGCGDSGGDGQEGSVGQWLDDISTAIDEIRRRCGLERVCLVGLRFGGALAMTAGAERGDIDTMILWDPIVNGKAYISELTSLHRKTLRGFMANLEYNRSDEMLGFPFTDQVRTEINDLDLLATQRKPANNLLVVESQEKNSEGILKQYFQDLDVRFEYKYLAFPKIWIDLRRALVPYQILQLVHNWISEVTT